MNPTEIIKDWFEEQTPEIQGDVAYFVLYLLEDRENSPAYFDDLAPKLLSWLTSGDEPSFRTVGKALSFVAAFDFCFASRFTPEGWKTPRTLFEQVIDEAPSEGMVATAKSSLADLPRKQELWAAVGSSWQAVRDRLSSDYLEAWGFKKK